MKMEIRAFLLLLIFLYSSYSTLALYEDQVGLMDWYPSLSRYLYMLIYYLVFVPMVNLMIELFAII